jgi:serine/threonine-protein kinase
MPSDEPKTLGSFVIEREIAEGGMGVVYAGRQPALNRTVALKKLRRDLASNDNLVERFEREARVAANVHHPNVVAVYDCFSYRGNRYIAQEFVDGVDLRTLLGRTGPLPPPIASRIALELARGLEEIHARGIVHRDLKPGNVLLGRGGETKIADFGIVLPPSGEALTEIGTVLGSPPYMAPEQLDGDLADARSDLYAFGVVLYEMLTGRVPHPPAGSEEGTTASIRRARRSRYPSVRKLAPATPRSLARLVRACLRPRPQRRIASATAIRQRLESRLGTATPGDCRGALATWLREGGVLAEENGHTVALTRPAPQARRWGAVRAVAAAAACACLMTGAVHYRHDRSEADAAAIEPEARDSSEEDRAR